MAIGALFFLGSIWSALGGGIPLPPGAEAEHAREVARCDTGEAQVEILTPGDEQHFPVGTPITFSVKAVACESGANVSSQVYWSSDEDGALGRGQRITSDHLRTGRHTIQAGLRPIRKFYPSATDTDYWGSDYITIHIAGHQGELKATPNPCVINLTRGSPPCETRLSWKLRPVESNTYELPEPPAVFDADGGLITPELSSEHGFTVVVPPNGEIYTLYDSEEKRFVLDRIEVEVVEPEGVISVEAFSPSPGSGGATNNPCTHIVRWNSFHADAASVWMQVAGEWQRLSPFPAGELLLEQCIASGEIVFELHEFQDHSSALLGKDGELARVVLEGNSDSKP